MSRMNTLDIRDDDKFERSKRIKQLDLNRIHNANVLLIGAGALGNEVGKNLVLSGYRNITVVDMDHIVKSNLNRCVYFSEDDAEKKRKKAEVLAKKLNMNDNNVNAKYQIVKIQDLPEKFIASFDIVFGCVDNIAARLHINAHCYAHNIPYIDGGTDGLIGRVRVVIPPSTSCIECGMNDTHAKILEKRFSCTGSETTFYEEKLAGEITTTSVIAAIQVREALKICSGIDSGLKNRIFYYDGLRCISEMLEIPINPECQHHKQ